MARRQLSDVHAGQVWRDRDKRMLSGNRRVLVMRVVGNGDVAHVYYRSAVGIANDPMGSEYRSVYERFQRGFDLVKG